MDKYILIFGRKFEYDFLSGWIKYLRIKENISQEALAYGVCSTSHLSYFENGKKKLRGESIEDLLKKLGIKSIDNIEDMGMIRQKFHRLMQQIESFDFEAAQITYNQLKELEPILKNSPINIEFNIYTLMYDALVERRSYEELSSSVDILDKIYNTFEDNLKHIYMLITGKLIYDRKDHIEGIRRLETAYKIKETQWINYRLGVAYCNNSDYLKGIIYLEKALNSYMLSGRYRNSIECHNFLGTCYTHLKLFEKAEFHFKAVFNGSDYFSIDKNVFGIYSSLAYLYSIMGRYEDSINYCKLAMYPPTSWLESSRWIKAAWYAKEQPINAACICVEVYKKLNDIAHCKEVFDSFLIDSNKNSKYFNYLYCLYLSVFHFKEDIFYKETTENILPYYRKIGNIAMCNAITLLLIKHLEIKRKYKEANRLYKELLSEGLL